MIRIEDSHKERTAKLISWGYWLTLFNIIIVLLISSQYIFLTSWPTTLLGQLYVIISWISHFSFITFACYIFIFVPLTFIIFRQKLFRFITILLITILISLLILDIQSIKATNLHLVAALSDNYNLLTITNLMVFIFTPLIFVVQLLLSSSIWQRKRKFNRKSYKSAPWVVILITCFILTNLIYTWADITSYQPIVKRETNMPLFYPITVKSLLTKIGWINPEQTATSLLELPVN